VTDTAPGQFDAFVTPGSMLKAAREVQQLSQREAADRLNFMPGYVAILERDDYQALRSPPFARGYVKAYGRLLGLDEGELLEAFDRLREQQSPEVKKKVETRPLQLQHTGLGVVIGLAVLCLLVLGLWWWQGDGGAQGKAALPANAELQDERNGGAVTAGES
jgi:cytoskeleton protein RodZ